MCSVGHLTCLCVYSKYLSREKAFTGWDDIYNDDLDSNMTGRNSVRFVSALHNSDRVSSPRHCRYHKSDFEFEA